MNRVFDGQKADFLAVEIVNILEVKDLGINLGNKEVYKLINKVNEAKYY